MSDHLVLYVDRLVRPVNVDSVTLPAKFLSDPSPASKSADIAGLSGSAPPAESDAAGSEHDEDGNEDKPLIPNAECRICQEEDSINNLEIPCACSGSLKYAHRKCVQHWCNEKGGTICEICYKPYQPGYIAPTSHSNAEETAIDIGGGWTISGAPPDFHDPQLLAIAEAERHYLEAEYDEYAASNASGAAFCRSAALILMALLLLRHAVSVPDADADDDPSTFFSIFLLRAAGFLLPCYIMAWAISILQRRRQRQEAAAVAATQVAVVLQSGQRRGLQFAIAPGPPVNAQLEHIV
ncbi:uncharacterized protein LOC114754091 isoform X2 [Neltuma alba]|uniref:uncharacterized protein LOC114754091 isoform X2 n=1 Tax=Neltuma alba TaxID=207710 RepID=UPI0010A41F5A|nr:uncharacterized protein LOC114754091 isoform X2 [Prosopis alba]